MKFTAVLGKHEAIEFLSVFLDLDLSKGTKVQLSKPLSTNEIKLVLTPNQQTSALLKASFKDGYLCIAGYSGWFR